MILDEILAHKREEVRERQERILFGTLQRMAEAQPPSRSLREALVPGSVRVIAEVKRRSPSKGALAPALDPVRTAAMYADHGAAAISVLTDERFFAGSLADLRAVRQAVELPILRKDFIIHGYQVVESRAYGADAVLLIAGVLDRGDLTDLLEEVRLYRMEALVEVHTEEELDIALDCGAEIIGINNRDLQTFETDLETTRRLAPLVPDDHGIISESGIHSREQVEELGRLGVHGVLVGEALVSAGDPGEKLRELVGR
ncbi:MAG: indole-3-glycerol phosphate synthase TrpC [Chloroflexota bacterium]|nr:indole-3-glycerol phosphate synthase TrpC [Chloroflexota bacterium]